MTPSPGEIWLADIPFTDGSASKIRPVLVLWLDAGDAVVAAVTSAATRSSTRRVFTKLAGRRFARRIHRPPVASGLPGTKFVAPQVGRAFRRRCATHQTNLGKSNSTALLAPRVQIMDMKLPAPAPSRFTATRQ